MSDLRECCGTAESAHASISPHGSTAALWPSRRGCTSAPRWSGGAGGLAVSMATRLGRAVHPWRRPGPRGEPKRGRLASLEDHRHRHPLSGARDGCASAPGWSGGAGGLAVSMAARLGRAVHPWRRPGPRGEPKRGRLASLEDHRHRHPLSGARDGCASAPGWSGGAGGLAVFIATCWGALCTPVGAWGHAMSRSAATSRPLSITAAALPPPRLSGARTAALRVAAGLVAVVG